MSDNTVINPGSGGDTVRDIQRSDGAKRQVVALDLGGGAAYPENLINAGQDTMLNSVPTTTAWDQPPDPTLVKIADLLGQLFPAERSIWSPFEQLAASIDSSIRSSVLDYVVLLPVASSGLESSHVMKSAAGALITLTASIGAVSGWLLVFDATSAPADGAVTPIWWMPVDSNGANGFATFSWAECPLKFSTGCVVVFSTTGPFTKTASATAAFSGQIQ